MKMGVRGAAMTSAMAASTLAVAGYTWASDVSALSLDSAAASLEEVLKSASDKGLVSFSQPEVVEDSSTRSISKTQTIDDEQTVDCAVVDAFDMATDIGVTDYAQLQVVRDDYVYGGDVEAKRQLVTGYLSLGMGTEAIALANDPMIGAIGRMVEQRVTHADRDRLASHAHCNRSAALLSFIANHSSGDGREPDVDVFELWPENLREILRPYLAVSLYKAGYRNVADAQAEAVHFRISRSLRAENLDHAGLVSAGYYLRERQPMEAAAIFRYLSERDGIHRAAALQQLALMTGSGVGEAYAFDLENIRHQYTGKAEARQAVLQSVKLDVDSGQYLSAIALVVSEMTPQDLEHTEALTVISEAMTDHLSDDALPEYRLAALNAYWGNRRLFHEMPARTALENSVAATIQTFELSGLADSLGIHLKPKRELAIDPSRTAPVALKVWLDATPTLRSGDIPGPPSELKGFVDSIDTQILAATTYLALPPMEERDRG